MSNFKLSFSLKQHTPLIHFQHYQKGASLRATEMKPKLDRFIWNSWEKKEGSVEAAFDKYKTYLVAYSEKKDQEIKKKFLGKEGNEGDKEYRALDYKMSVSVKGKTWTDYIEQPKKENGRFRQKRNSTTTETYYYPLYFGNMGTNYEETETVKKFEFHEEVLISIKSFNTKLLPIIESLFPQYIALHNFGSRQGKGFGSFYCMDTSKYPIKDSWFDYKFELSGISRDNKQKFKDLFNRISLFYGSIRGGINKKDKHRDKFYFKSLLFLY